MDSRSYPTRPGIGPLTAYAIAVAARAHATQLHQEARHESDELNRLKDQFLATLSHELRTPINSILGYAQLLTLDTLAPERVQHALQAIERNAHSQARLIESLLDLSRIQAGKLQLRVQQLDLASVVSRAVDVVRPAAEARGVALEISVPEEDSVQVLGDPDRLQQVVWNLVANAVKFTPRGGAINVGVLRADAEVRIEVRDTGKGISAELLPHVFERFRQGHPSTAQPSGGLGIGLAIVRELVEAHGGSVSAASAGADQGSTFSVVLPSRGAGVQDSVNAPTQLQSYGDSPLAGSSEPAADSSPA